MRLFIDLDDTLCDFNRYFKERTGISIYRFIAKNGIFSYEYALTETIGNINRFWENIPIMHDAIILWHYIRKYNPTILTSITSYEPHRSNAIKGKTRWVYTNLGPNINILFSNMVLERKMFSDKHIFCKNSTDILIDDSKRNITNWNNSGGKGILHTNAIKTIRKIKQIV